MPKMTVTKSGKELTIWVSDESGLMIAVGTGLNLPDAKLAARGAITKLQYGLERLKMVDVKAVAS